MRLTDASVRALPNPENGQRTHFDDAVTGFGVRVSRGGTKTFVLMHGRERRLTSIGRVGVISLSDARKKARHILARRALGITEHSAITLGEARELFLTSSERRLRARTLSDYRRLLTKHFAKLDKSPLRAISGQDVGEIIDRLQATPVEQNHAFAVARTFFRFCVRREFIGRSPLEGMRLPARIQTRDRVLDDDELVAVLKAAREIGYPFGTIVELLILTGQRKGEVAAIERSWIGDDAITVPKHVSKNHRTHTLPYGSLTAAVFASVPVPGERLFTVYNWDKHTKDLREKAGIQHFVLHDLRRSYASGLASLGVPPHVVEKLLNHVSGTVSGVAAVYNRYSYMSEMREAVSTWESHLSMLLTRAHR